MHSHISTADNFSLFGKFLLVAVSVVLAGCGSAKYEERLGATVKMFDHMHRLDKELKKPFRDKESKIQYRPPRNFKLIPAPKPIHDEEGNLIYPELDERQPIFLEEDLPGMIASWSADVTADLDGESVSAEAHIYLISNLSHLAEPGTASYTMDVLEILSRELGIEIAEGSLQEELYPGKSSQGFVKQVAYKVRTIIPAQLIDGVEAEFTIYLHRNGDSQIFLLTAIPKDVNRRDDLMTRLDLSLQTLKTGASSSSSGEKSSKGSKRGSGKATF